MSYYYLHFLGEVISDSNNVLFRFDLLNVTLFHALCRGFDIGHLSSNFQEPCELGYIAFLVYR